MKIKKLGQGRARDPLGGVEIARILLRGMVGGTMVAHGVRHGRTLEGTAGWFASIGFRQPRMQAQLSSVVEVGAGTALIAGAATPVAASAVIGTMTVAARTVHLPNGFFIVSEGWEYVAVLSAAAASAAALGGGRFSVDRLLGLHERGTGLQRAALAIGLGVGGAAVQLKTFWSPPTPK